MTQVGEKGYSASGTKCQVTGFGITCINILDVKLQQMFLLFVT